MRLLDEPSPLFDLGEIRGNQEKMVPVQGLEPRT